MIDTDRLIMGDTHSEEFDLTKMSWGDHDILTVTSHEYFTATSF